MTATPPLRTTCGSCGNSFAAEELAEFGQHRICAACKPGFVQAFGQGMVADPPRPLRYAGFWVRFFAMAVDLAILLSIRILLSLLAAVLLDRVTPEVASDLRVVSFLLDAFYFCFFWTHSGATPGKMLFGIWVANTRGETIRLTKAVKRLAGQYFSAVFLGYGFLRAGWSAQKMSLSDDLAGTRVIYTR